MTSPATTPTLPVADLLDRPGASRRIALALPVPDDLDLDLAEVVGPLRLHGVVESVVEGLLVRGEMTSDLKVSCARCLQQLEVTVSADITELFVDPTKPGTEDEVDAGYEIRDAELNLDTLLRDALVPSLPYRPLCDEACAGLCPTCGTDLNEAQCDCVDVTEDPRWAVLRGLRLPDARPDTTPPDTTSNEPAADTAGTNASDEV